MKTYTIVILANNGMSYAYVGDFEKMPTFTQAKKIISKTGHEVSRVLAIVETANNGFVTSSGMTFWLDYLIEGKK